MCALPGGFGLPLLHAAFARGELSYSKLRLVSKVADAESEEKLLDLASRVSTGQLQRLLRSYARVTKDQARLAHEQGALRRRMRRYSSPWPMISDPSSSHS